MGKLWKIFTFLRLSAVFQIRERIEHAKTEAKTHLNTKPKTLWQDARRDLTEEQKEHMVKFDSFRRTIEKTRIIPERLLVDEKDMTKMQITVILIRKSIT